jgi:hypothetical protein
MGRPAGLEARAGRRDQRSLPMNVSARTEMEAEAGSSVHFSLDAQARQAQPADPGHNVDTGLSLRLPGRARGQEGRPPGPQGSIGPVLKVAVHSIRLGYSKTVHTTVSEHCTE